MDKCRTFDDSKLDREDGVFDGFALQSSTITAALRELVMKAYIRAGWIESSENITQDWLVRRSDDWGYGTVW
jgi:hypothetical protein